MLTCVWVWVCESCEWVRVRCMCVWVGWEHVCWCSVLYASEPVPAGIRKVDLGHKYLISVCCPWKSSIYSWPDGKMPLPDPFPSLADKKKSRPGSGGRILTWCGWGGTDAQPEGEKKGKEIKILISGWWEAITRKLQTDSFHKHPPYCLFALRRSAIRYNEKLSQMAKYWILCVWYCLTVKPNKCQYWNCWLCTPRLLALSYSDIF